MNKVFKILTYILATIVCIAYAVLVLAMVINHRSADPSTQDENEIEPLLFQVVDQEVLSFDGVVQLSSDQVYYFSTEKGKFGERYVNEGDEVAVGAPLFSYYKEDIGQQMADISRQLDRLYVKRAQGYTAPQGLTPMEGDVGEGGEAMVDPAAEAAAWAEDLNTQISDLEYNLNRLNDQVYEVVYAQNDGQVSLDEKGKMDSTIPYMRVTGGDTVVQASVGEFDLYAVKEGRPVEVKVKAEDRLVKGTINKVQDLPQAPAQGQAEEGDLPPASTGLGEAQSSTSFPFEVRLRDTIHPGFSVSVLVSLEGFTIPSEALIEEGAKTYVLKSVDGIAEKVEVSLGKQGLQEVVTSGLKAEDIIILNPMDIEEGQAIDESQLMPMDNDMGQIGEFDD